eukprot:352475-Chlamydomonas_euryale.AAC.1
MQFILQRWAPLVAVLWLDGGAAAAGVGVGEGGGTAFAGIGGVGGSGAGGMGWDGTMAGGAAGGGGLGGGSGDNGLGGGGGGGGLGGGGGAGGVADASWVGGVGGSARGTGGTHFSLTFLASPSIAPRLPPMLRALQLNYEWTSGDAPLSLLGAGRAAVADAPIRAAAAVAATPPRRPFT